MSLTFFLIEEPVILEVDKIPGENGREKFWDYKPRTNTIFIARTENHSAMENFLTEARRYYHSLLDKRKKEVQKFLSKRGIEIVYRE